MIRYVAKWLLRHNNDALRDSPILIVTPIYHPLLWLAATATLIATPAHAWQLEGGEVGLNNTFNTPAATRVTFAQVYDTVPVVVALPNQRGGDPSALRVSNVSTLGFDVVQVEPTGNDGPHLDMPVSYLVVQPGSHVLPDGTRVSAGVLTTTAVQHGSGVTGAESWARVTFADRFDAAPVFVAALQSINNESNSPPGAPSQPWLTVAVQNAARDGADVALERSEAGPGAVVTPEAIGWIAIDADVTGTLIDNAGASVAYEAQKTDARFRGWTDGCTTIDFLNNYATAPRAVATKRTRFEDDGGWLRNCSVNASRIGLRVDEDRDFDNERTHVAEAADLIAFATDFDARFDPQINMTKTETVLSDPISGANPKAIPGAVIGYTLRVINAGNGAPDLDSVEVIDPVPSGTALMVADIAGAGSGPVQFADGGTASGLTLSFAGLGSGLDDVSFSDDGGATFDYTPTADARGADASVTHLRVTPRGRFNPTRPVPGTAPEYTLNFRVVVN